MEIYATLRDNFKLQIHESKQNAEMKILFIPTPNQWTFQLFVLNGEMGISGREENSKIVIEPTKENVWSLPIQSINLEMQSVDETAFTSLWKSLDFILRKAGREADLVQLNSYYQYPPTLVISTLFNLDKKQEKSLNWKALEQVLSGNGVRKTITKVELSRLWNIDTKKIHDVCKWLRSIGYEIRNWNTNPQIKQGSYLIPYAFPTLSHQSVQTQKSLGRS
jgi:DNA (cytosine-5)-methyltransferase 1